MNSTTGCSDGRLHELIVFDVQVADAVERLLSERAAWGEGAAKTRCSLP